MNEETSLWKGSSSQWLNLGSYAAALVVAVGIVIGGITLAFPPAFAALAAPLLFAIWKFLVVRMRVYELSCERLRITSGVINQHIDEIELYRVKDTLVLRPWWMRLTGLASIALETSDRTLPKLVIPAIPDGMKMRETLRKQVEIQRDKKRVREMDFDDSMDGDLV
jgi:uncharacterized membrane protein YdbT with pleckstrin-like domain